MTDFTYTVRRANRRTLCVKICDNNSLLVSCPFRTSEAQIKRLLNSKKAWIERNLAKNAENNGFLADVIAYKTVLICGKQVPLTLGGTDKFSENEISARDFNHLKNLLIKCVSPAFLQTLEEIKNTSGLKCNSVSFRNYKSRWGCCNIRKEIVFNYKLLMLPKKLWRYVAVHELCHTVHMDHSKKFYALVEKLMPDYKTAQRELKKYSRIIRLY